MRILSIGICFSLMLLFLSEVIEYPEPEHRVTYSDMLPTAKVQIDCLADNIYFEAGNQKDIGKVAVAMVTLNRVNSSKFKNNVCAVVYQKKGKVCQFSWFCENKSRVKEVELYETCKKVALYTYLNYGKIPDVTKGSTFYHATYVNPQWSNLKQTVKIGAHIFYKPKGDVELKQFNDMFEYDFKQTTIEVL